MESEPLCDLLPLAFEPTDTSLQAYALPATPGVVTQLENVLSDYKADITALQEMGRTGQGRSNLSFCDIYYIGHASRHEFGCGFAVRRNLGDLKIYCS